MAWCRITAAPGLFATLVGAAALAAVAGQPGSATQGGGQVDGGVPPPVRWGDVELSPTDEFRNQEAIQQMLFHRFYFSGEVDTEWGNIESDLRTLKSLGTGAMPAIAIGVANGLYHFFFFQEHASPAAMRTDTMFDALQLYNASLRFSKCLDPETELQEFLLGMCTTKFAFVHLLAGELGAAFATSHDLEAASAVLGLSAQLFRQMLGLPYYALGGGLGWSRPQDMAFNHELYPNYYGAVWPKEQVPLAAFLEAHYEAFRADLESILASSGLFDHLRELERNAEGLSVWPPGTRKHIELADLREDEPWKGQLCHFAPRTCELMRTRPEVAQCPRAAVMIARLGPRAWLKPHYGNSRRLVAHLGLIAPPGPITLSVGSVRGLTWEAGKAMIFDDTHAHDARHEGEEGERYILHTMFCHPCEQKHLYPNLPPEACEFRNPIRAEVSRALRQEMDAKEVEMKKAVRMVIPHNAPQDV